ncbi:PAS domain-containing sensor histidine kinase [Martelella soudanensis]|uniref:PAS domain-containing sensor histidine kinase n=1 Tax=unclassified Martelella TaxID=2629616 RepID=UPI0015E034CE|nr:MULTISPECIES: ATP-binding protein [unclassified Martelella]
MGGMSERKQGSTPIVHWPVAAAAATLAAAIFVVDAFTPFRYAIAVLYVLVLLLAANVLGRRGVVIVTLFCILLIFIGFLIQHPFDETGAVARAWISVVAVAVTAALTLVNKASTEILANQAALLDLTHDAIFSRTPKDVILSWNRGAEVLYGWKKEEAIGKRSTELLGAESPAAWHVANEKLVLEGRWEGQVRRKRRNGDPRVIMCRWALQRDRAGAPMTVLETHSDITERMEAEFVLDRTREELAHAERLSTLGELTASIVHEVNQPLAAISASGDASLRWLKRNDPDIGEATVLIERIVASAQRASNIISSLRAFARRSPSMHSTIIVNDLVDDIIPLLSREMRAHKVVVDFVRDPRSSAVQGDRVQLQQVLINLVVNAIQAMESSKNDMREIHIAIASGHSEGQDTVEVRVDDTGPGFGPEEGQKLFSPFFTTKAQGMGIGLSICRRIVEAHGGYIWAKLRDEGGAEFGFHLPRSEGGDG